MQFDPALLVPVRPCTLGAMATRDDAAAPGPGNPTRPVAALVTGFYDRLWNSWDEDEVQELLDRDFVFRGTLGGASIGRKGWRTYREQIRAGAPDLHVEVVQVISEGAVAAARLLLTGTHTGELLGMTATQRRFAYAGSAFFQVRRGRVTQVWGLARGFHGRSGVAVVS